jgi:hypothetical protein
VAEELRIVGGTVIDLLDIKIVSERGHPVSILR